jgi:broad specificity phosphatase PhoE
MARLQRRDRTRFALVSQRRCRQLSSVISACQSGVTLLGCRIKTYLRWTLSKALKLTVLCHGATMDQRAVRFPADEPLLPGELVKLRELALANAWPARCISAPEWRTRQTVDALGIGYALEPRLKDIDFGEWSGRTLDEIAETKPSAMQSWLADPSAAPHGGESICELLERVGVWMEDMREMRGHVLLVTHPSVIRAIILFVLEAPLSSFWNLDVQHLSVSDIRSDGRRWTIRSLFTA